MSRPGRIAVDRPYALVDGRGYALTSQGARPGIPRHPPTCPTDSIRARAPDVESFDAMAWRVTSAMTP
jgi:hypothetical protein